MSDSPQDRPDLRPSAAALAAVVRRVRDDQLGNPTPCGSATVADLLDHVNGLTVAFTAAARKERLPEGGRASYDGDSLDDGWRDDIPDRLGALGEAWLDPAAFEGTTVAGGLEMPADQVAVVALDEVTVHAWDLAVATGQGYEGDEASMGMCAAWAASFPAPRDGSLFGPMVDVTVDAPALHRLLGATGRDPRWTP